MNKKIMLIFPIIVVVVIVLWDVISDVLLGPTKDMIDQLVSPYLQKEIKLWMLILPIIILVSIFFAILRIVKNTTVKKNTKAEIDITKFIKKYTDKACKKNYVISTQLYRYKFRKKNNYKIRLTYQDGYVLEDEKINAVVQDYFEVDRTLFNQLKEGIEEHRKHNNFNKLNVFLNTTLVELNASSMIINYRKESVQFSLFVLGLQYVLNNANETNPNFLGANRIVRILNHPQKEQDLYTLSRTGLMRAILNTELNLSSLYCFEHIGTGDKVGRVYLTINVLRKGETDPYLFLITVDPRIESEENQPAMLSNILKDFINELKNELEIEDVQTLGLVV